MTRVRLALSRRRLRSSPVVASRLSAQAQAAGPLRHRPRRDTGGDQRRSTSTSTRRHGLPEGKGTVAEGATVYAAKCASRATGRTGEGGKFDRLVGPRLRRELRVRDRREARARRSATTGRTRRRSSTTPSRACRSAAGHAHAGRNLRRSSPTSCRSTRSCPRRGDGQDDAAQGGDAGARSLRDGQSHRRQAGEVRPVNDSRRAPPG